MTNPQLAEKILARLVPVGGCLEWSGPRNREGYGRIYLPVRRSGFVHRVLWEAAVGPIPDGYQIDHLCFNRACANLWHLEPVTPQVNFSRSLEQIIAANPWRSRTHCKNGHEWTPENTFVRTKGRFPGTRVCRACNRAVKQRSKDREVSDAQA